MTGVSPKENKHKNADEHNADSCLQNEKYIWCYVGPIISNKCNYLGVLVWKKYGYSKIQVSFRALWLNHICVRTLISQYDLRTNKKYV